MVRAGTAVGFLLWNWQPAEILLGDMGAIPLGFILGYLKILLAVQGYLVAATVMPLYAVFDATGALIRRVVSGETSWQPHKTHVYQ